jgi:cell division protein FtsW
MTTSTDNPSSLREIDWLMVAVLALCSLGLVMAVSVSGPSVGAMAALKGQGTKLLAGLVAFLCCALVPLERLQRWALPAFVVATALCVVPFVLGLKVKGAYRWIQFGSFSLQPVEIARFLLVITAATLLARSGDLVHTFRRGFLPSIGCAIALAGALVLQPDHGNALIVVCLVATMALVAGVRVLHFMPFALAALVLVLTMSARHGYVHGRLQNFLSIEPGTQVGQSLVAIAAGGATGVGLGEGWMKMGFVSEAQNDFVFAVVAEEFGFLGSLLVLALFTTIGVVGCRLCLQLRDRFRRYLVFGFTLMLCMQAAINLMVVCGWAPAKGIDLPFVSSGGTSLVFCLSAIGLIGNAARSDHARAGVTGNLGGQ